MIKTMINKSKRRAFEGFFQATAAAADLSVRQKKTRSQCEIHKDIPYVASGDPGHLLDVYKPRKAPGPLPVLLYIHGGGFTICSKETHRGIATAYAHHGKMLVFNINYRLAPGNRFPAAVEDASLAYEWAVQNARRFGGDPQQMFVAGESAGGNLTLALALASSVKRPEPAARRVWDTGVTPRAVMVLCGLLQVSETQRFLEQYPQDIVRPWLAVQQNMVADVSRAYLGRGWRRPGPEKMLADPLLWLESGEKPDRPFPDVFAMVGEKDILVHDTRRLEAALKHRGITHEVRFYPGEGHVFHIASWKKSAMDFWRANFRFLYDRREKVQG